MGFGMYSLIEAVVLTLNAVCVLHEERFLAKLPGWESAPAVPGYGEEATVKAQLFHLIRSIRTVMKYPLVPMNIFIIIFKLLFG
ncbi:immediate early response 3-interacting protein 1 [Hyalella azteca]|uniref:Immediate early response 3-interacting protein 1 n=1 Tax=Hyalella azteca TaxID=294128 RepID=A0A8B7NNI7_HYAAZ|nr:immediate early response 3-interacting protein 1 [Hyalella azteca]